MKKDIASIAVIVITSLLLISPIFKDGYLIAQDNPPHLAESYYLIEELTPKGKLFGWSNIESAGFPIFAYNYPLGYWIVSFIHYILGSDVATSYKLLVYFSYLIPIVLVYLILKNTFGRSVALIISVLILFQFDFLSFILNGLWGQYLGLVFGLIYIYLITKQGLKLELVQYILLGILISLSFLSHPFTIIFLAYFTLIFLFIKKIMFKGKIRKLLLLLLISWLIGFMLMPWKLLLDSGSLLQTYKSVESERLSTLTFKSMGYLFLPHLRAESIKTKVGWEKGEIRFENVIANMGNLATLSILNIAELIFSILAIAGLVAYLKSSGRNFELTVYLAALVLTVVIASGILKPLLENYLPLVSGLFQFPRYFVYARIIMVFFAAHGLSMLANNSILSNFDRKTRKGNFPFFYLIVYVILLLSFTQIQELLSTKTSKDVEELENLNKIWLWLKENVSPDETRVFYQNTYGNSEDVNLRNSHMFALSTHNTKIESVGTWQGGFPTISKKIYSGGGQLLESTVQNIETSEIVEALKTYNAMYFVTSEKHLDDKLASSESFRKNVTYGSFSIFSLENYSPTWIRINGQDANSKVIKTEIEHKKFSFHITDKNSLITVKITYHPYWKAYLNGRKVETGRNDFGMIELASDENGDIMLELIYSG